MRALVVLPSGVRGGAEAVAFSLIREWHARGMEVVVYALVGGMQPELAALSLLERVTIIATGRKQERIGVFQAIWKIHRLSRNHRFDLVYSTHVHVNAMLGLMRRLGLLKCGVLVARESTVVFDRFEGSLGMLFRLFYAVGYGPQDLLIAQTEEMKRNLVSALGRTPVPSFKVIKNPVDAARIEGLVAASKSLEPADCGRVVACGRLVDNKGFAQLIRAFERLSDAFPAYRLELIGGGPNADRLRAMVPPALRKKILFHGPQENPFAYMANADVGVICSRREGFPNVLLEMMACGVKRIVATPCTDALAGIEGLFMADGFGVEQLAETLGAAMASSADHRAVYATYLEREHSLSDFSTRVIQAI